MGESYKRDAIMVKRSGAMAEPHPIAILEFLPDDLLPHVVEQLCGGEDIHDITLWKHACQLAQTCTTFSRLVVQSDHCDTGLFDAQLVGPDVQDDDDPYKVAHLSVERGIWHYAPRVTVSFKFGGVSTLHRAMPLYVHSLEIKVPLLLEDVLRVFYKPPGWHAAGKLALSGKDAPPWRECFPTDKYPQAPERVRTGGDMEAKYTCELLKPQVDARGQRWYDESTAELTLPAATHVTATCSTGIETFKRAERAHYLDDLELGLVGVFAPEFLALPTVQNFFEALELSTEEPPDLYYRFEPSEARRLAGYPTNRLELHKMLHPPKLRKLKQCKKPEDSDEEERWDPNERARKKAAARKRIKQSTDADNEPEDSHIDEDSFLPAYRKGKRLGGLVVDFDLQGYETADEVEPRLLPGWKKMGRLQSDGTLNDMRYVSPCGRISSYKLASLEKEHMLRPAHLVKVQTVAHHCSDSDSDESFVVADNVCEFEEDSDDEEVAERAGPSNEGLKKYKRVIEDPESDDAPSADSDEEDDAREREILANIRVGAAAKARKSAAPPGDWAIERGARRNSGVYSMLFE